MKKLVIGLVALAVLAGVGIGLYGVLGGSRAEQPTGPTYAVQMGTLTVSASASGTIEPHIQVDVKSKASGEVTKLLVQEGDVVHTGQLLVELDPTDAQRAVQSAQVDLAKVRAQLEEARANLAGSQADQQDADTSEHVAHQGAGMGVVSSESERTATHAAAVAKNSVAMRRAQVAEIRAQVESSQLALADAQKRLSETKITAPMSGTVLSTAVEVGSIVASAVNTVSGGTPVLTIADLTDLRVIGQLDESQVAKVHVGQDATVRVDAYPNRAFTARVERVSPLGVTTSNVVTFDVETIITDSHRDLLRSGMSADLDITVQKIQGLLVPLTAVRSQGRQRFVVMASGQSRPIRTGVTDGTDILVRSGLSAGDRIESVMRATGAAKAPTSGLLPFGHHGGGGGGGRPH